MDKHSELERKFFAGHVEKGPFDAFCSKLNPLGFKTAAFPDVYYRQGDNVVRHRLLKGAGELTIKRRKSAHSIDDRVEVDLGFAADMTAEDIKTFLFMSGFRPDFTLLKHFSRVWWFQHGHNATVAVSLYEVERQDTRDTRRFLEVEVEKSSNIDPGHALVILDVWSGVLMEEFDLADPQTESLYEIYSGRRYLTV